MHACTKVVLLSLALWGTNLLLEPLRGEEVAPLPPGQTLDTRFRLPAAKQTRIVKAGDNLQSVLDAAAPGDVIELEAGATFSGNYVLRDKGVGEDWIYIVSSRLDELPAAGTRVGPADADRMSRIASPNSDPTLYLENGAHHFRFVGVEVTTSSSINYNLVYGPGGESIEEQPHHIIFDRSYIHGTPTGNIRRGVVFNGRWMAVVDSHLSDFHEVGADSQAIAGWNGAGPFKIVNNYLEAAGENVMFGGAVSAVEGLIPSDIEIRGNHVRKPLNWYRNDPSYDGSHWSVKNLFELKNAQRVIVQGNLFENNWLQAQVGFAIVFTPRREGGLAPQAVVRDVLFEQNILRHTASGIDLYAADGSSPYSPDEPQLERFAIRDNLIYDVNRSRFGGDGRLLMITGPSDAPPAEHITIENNTMLHGGSGNSLLTLGDSTTVARHFIFQDNIATYGDYGVSGSGQGVGTAALGHYVEDGVFVKNVLPFGKHAPQYPIGNFFLSTLDEVGFVDYANEVFRLGETSPYRNADDDGKDIGADSSVLQALSVSRVSDGRRSGHSPIDNPD